MKRLILALLPLALVCCNKAPQKAAAALELNVESVSSTGCHLSVQMNEVTDHYLMAILPQNEFSWDKAEQLLAGSAKYRNEVRVFERLSGSKDFVVAAVPVDAEGKRGDKVSASFTLGDMDLEVLLYTPGAGDTEQLNKYNTLNMMAFSNGIAAKVRCCLAVNEAWELLKIQKGNLKAAAEEVFKDGYIEFTRQMLEELANPNKLKRDILYFNPLDAGTKYTLVVCLEDLDGESYYYSFDGKTEAKPEP